MNSQSLRSHFSEGPLEISHVTMSSVGHQLALSLLGSSDANAERSNYLSTL